MPNVVKILRSTTTGAVPSSLVSGQIAINEKDGKLFWLDTTSGQVYSVTINGLDAAVTSKVSQTGATGAANLPNGTTAQRPTGSAGQLRYNSTTGKFEGYGSAWGNIGGGATISDTAPSNPGAGDLWWNSADGILYVYYNDGNSSQWVATDAGGEGQYVGLADVGTVTTTILADASVTTAKIANANVTTAKIADANITPAKLSTGAPSWDASGNVTASGTVADSTAIIRPLVAGTVNAGGTNPFPASNGPVNVDFTGIPSWVKRITVMFNGVSTNGTSQVQVQIGSGSVSSSGYNCAVGYSTGAGAYGSANTGFILEGTGSASAAALRYGSLIISLVGSNIWAGQLCVYNTVATTNYSGSGATPSLSGALDRVRITTVNGTDKFDAGSINILYE